LEDKSLVSLLKGGFSYNFVAKSLRRTVGAVKAQNWNYHHVKIKGGIKYWTSSEKSILVSMLKSGFSYKDVAKKLGRTCSSVKDYNFYNCHINARRGRF